MLHTYCIYLHICIFHAVSFLLSSPYAAATISWTSVQSKEVVVPVVFLLDSVMSRENSSAIVGKEFLETLTASKELHEIVRLSDLRKKQCCSAQN